MIGSGGPVIVPKT